MRTCVCVALLAWVGLAHGQEPVPVAPAPWASKAYRGDGPLIRLQRLGGLTLEPDAMPLRLDAYRAWAGLDAELEIWPPSVPAKSIWVMVQGQSSDTWFSYGPALHSQGRWIVPGVRFGEGIDQGRSFQLRAVILPADIEPSSGRTLAGWLARALALSPALPVSVEHRAVVPSRRGGTARLWISTIDHRTPAVLEPMATAAVVEVEGTVLLPDGGAERAPSGGPSQIYVVVRPVGGSGWRAFGPAGINGETWHQPAVAVAEAGERHWLHYRLHAVLAWEPPPADHEDSSAYDRWRQRAGAVSRSVDLTIRPRETPPILPSPAVHLEEARSAQGESIRPQELISLRASDTIVEVSGRVEGVPQGAYVWVLVQAADTPVWKTLGPALLEPPRWRLPLAASSGESSASGARLIAILTTDARLAGWLSYSSWRPRALAVSESLSWLVEGAVEAAPEAALKIRRVAGAAVANPHTAAALFEDASVRGTVTERPEGAEVWVATRPLDSQQWTVSGPAMIHGDTW